MVQNTTSSASEITRFFPELHTSTISSDLKILCSISKTLATVINPLTKLDADLHDKADEFIDLLSDKIKNIPSKYLMDPSLYILGPTLNNLKFSLKEPELCELYLNLLVCSMDSRKNSRVNNTFIDTIKTLSPRDVRFFKYLFNTESTYPVLSLRTSDSIILNHFILDSFEGLCDYEISDCFETLQRLGLITITYTQTPIESDLPFVNSSIFNSTTDSNVYLIKGYATLSHFGKAFYDICL